MEELKNICLLEIDLWNLFKRFWKNCQQHGFMKQMAIGFIKYCQGIGIIVRKKKGGRVNKKESLHSKF